MWCRDIVLNCVFVWFSAFLEGEVEVLSHTVMRNGPYLDIVLPDRFKRRFFVKIENFILATFLTQIAMYKAEFERLTAPGWRYTSYADAVDANDRLKGRPRVPDVLTELLGEAKALMDEWGAKGAVPGSKDDMRAGALVTRAVWVDLNWVNASWASMRDDIGRAVKMFAPPASPLHRFSLSLMHGSADCPALSLQQHSHPTITRTTDPHHGAEPSASTLLVVSTSRAGLATAQGDREAARRGKDAASVQPPPSRLLENPGQAAENEKARVPKSNKAFMTKKRPPLVSVASPVSARGRGARSDDEDDDECDHEAFLSPTHTPSRRTSEKALKRFMSPTVRLSSQIAPMPSSAPGVPTIAAHTSPHPEIPRAIPRSRKPVRKTSLDAKLVGAMPSIDEGRRRSGGGAELSNGGAKKGKGKERRRSSTRAASAPSTTSSPRSPITGPPTTAIVASPPPKTTTTSPLAQPRRRLSGRRSFGRSLSRHGSTRPKPDDELVDSVRAKDDLAPSLTSVDSHAQLGKLATAAAPTMSRGRADALKESRLSAETPAFFPRPRSAASAIGVPPQTGPPAASIVGLLQDQVATLAEEVLSLKGLLATMAGDGHGSTSDNSSARALAASPLALSATNLQQSPHGFPYYLINEPPLYQLPPHFPSTYPHHLPHPARIYSSSNVAWNPASLDSQTMEGSSWCDEWQVAMGAWWP